MTPRNVPNPRPLLDEGATAFEAEMLRAGRRDAPTARSRHHIGAALGIGGALSAGTLAASAKTGALNWFSTIGVGKVLAGGAVVALTAWVGVEIGMRAHIGDRTPPTLPHQLAPQGTLPLNPASSPAPPAALPPPERSGIQPPQAASKLQTARVARRIPSQPGRDPLSDELRALDAARHALLQGDTGQTLGLLDDYARRFPQRRLEAESTVLRVEALAARGDRSGAARVGRDFLSRYANSPYARRVRTLIGEAPSPSKPSQPR